MVFTHKSDGTTTPTGKIIDQAALHGLLKKVRELEMPLISVNRIGYGQTEDADVEIKSVSDK